MCVLLCMCAQCSCHDTCVNVYPKCILFYLPLLHTNAMYHFSLCVDYLAGPSMDESIILIHVCDTYEHI